MRKNDQHKSAEAGAKQRCSGQRDTQRFLIGQKLNFFGDTLIFIWIGPELIWAHCALNSIYSENKREGEKLRKMYI